MNDKTTLQQSLTRYVDKSDIQDVILRYARGVDRRAMDMVRSTYHLDAYDDHGDYKGGIDGLIAWIVARHGDVPQSMHFLGNCLVEFVTDDVALVETYFSRRRVSPKAGEVGGMREVVDAESLGRYVDRFERRNGEWRVARRVVVYDAVMTSVRASPMQNPAWEWSSRDSRDVLFRMRDEVTRS